MERRLAQPYDLDEIMEIIADSSEFMRVNGINQWQNGQPSRKVFARDIDVGNCYVYLDKIKIVGVISVLLEKEPSYDIVYDGKWLTDDTPYGVFHRVAVCSGYRGKGISGEMLSDSEIVARENGFGSMRGDTHRNNKAMRRMLEKHGYIQCGTIHINESPPGDVERVCYEKILEDYDESL